MTTAYDTLVTAHTDLVDYWRPGETNTAINGNNLASEGTPGTAVLPDGTACGLFDGDNDFFYCDDAPELSPLAVTGEMSLECWVAADVDGKLPWEWPKSNSVGKYTYFLGKGGSSSDNEYGMRMYGYSTPGESPARPHHSSGYVFNPPGSLGVGSRYSDPNNWPGKWMHVVFTANVAAPRTRMWIDGVMVDEDNTFTIGGTTVVPADGIHAFMIGAWAGALTDGYFKGRIGRVALYSSELDGTTIAAHYAAGNSPLISTLGSATANTSGTTLDIVLPNDPASLGYAGKSIVLRSTGEYTASAVSVAFTTGGNGNTFSPVRTGKDGTNAVRGSFHLCRVGTGLSAGATIRLTWPASVSHRAAVADLFKYDLVTLADDALETTEGASGNSTSPSCSVTPGAPSPTRLVIALVGGLTDIANGFVQPTTWNALPRVGTSGVTVNGGYKYGPADGNTSTYNPTFSTAGGKWVNLTAAFRVG